MARGTFDVRSFHDGAITAVDACSGQAFARHAHDEFGIGLITSGAQRSWSGRGAVEAIRGDLITVNPGEMHDGSPIGQERSWSMLYVSQALVSSVVADVSEDIVITRELHAPVVTDAGLARLFLRTREAAFDRAPGAALEEPLIALLGLLFGAKSSPAAFADRRIEQVRERIDDDPAGRHPLAELATLAGLSRFHTLRAFTRVTGFTPHAYVTHRRLDAARRLIRDGAPPAAAAAEAGFADQSHMHRLFVARHGFTPGAYAEAYRRRTATSFKSVPPAHR